MLAIAAHPDDVEMTCGGTLIKMAEKGYRTGVLDLTAGDMGTRGTPETRLEEAGAAARHLLLAWRGNLHLPDARLENTLASRMTLGAKIRELRPRVVILPIGKPAIRITTAPARWAMRLAFWPGFGSWTNPRRHTGHRRFSTLRSTPA